MCRLFLNLRSCISHALLFNLSLGIGCIDLGDWSYSLAEMVDNYVPGLTGNDRGEAWISARSHWSNPAAANGAIVYDIESCSALTSTPVSTVLAPSSIAFY